MNIFDLIFAGVHRSRTIPHFKKGFGIIQGLDERHLQCKFKTSVRLLPMLERLVRRVFVNAQIKTYNKEFFLSFILCVRVYLLI